MKTIKCNNKHKGQQSIAENDDDYFDNCTAY